LNRSVIKTSHAPAAIGPYSQAIKTGDFVFVSGQIGLDPETATLQDGLEAQTEQILKNLATILVEAGSNMQNVVKTTIFLTNMDDFARVNRIYSIAFAAKPPARSTVAVSALPLGALVEIEATAIASRGYYSEDVPF